MTIDRPGRRLHVDAGEPQAAIRNNNSVASLCPPPSRHHAAGYNVQCGATSLPIYLLIAVAAEAVLVRLNLFLMRSSDGRRGRWDATDIAGTIVLAMLWPVSQVIPAAAIRARYSRTVLCEMPSSREITRVAAPAPKRNVISRWYPPMYPPHPSLHRLHWSSGCRSVADPRDATSASRSSPSHRWTASSERWTPSERNAGRDQIRTPDAIRSEHLDGLPQNRTGISRDGPATSDAIKLSPSLQPCFRSSSHALTGRPPVGRLFCPQRITRTR